MGKQARSRAKTRTPKQYPEWNPTRAHRERLTNRHEIPREWLDVVDEQEHPPGFYVTALPGNVDEPLPRSMTGCPELDDLLSEVWANRR